MPYPIATRAEINTLPPGVYQIAEPPTVADVYDPLLDQWHRSVSLQLHARVQETGEIPRGADPGSYVRPDGKAVAFQNQATFE